MWVAAVRHVSCLKLNEGMILRHYMYYWNSEGLRYCWHCSKAAAPRLSTKMESQSFAKSNQRAKRTVALLLAAESEPCLKGKLLWFIRRVVNFAGRTKCTCYGWKYWSWPRTEGLKIRPTFGNHPGLAVFSITANSWSENSHETTRKISFQSCRRYLHKVAN